MWSRTQESLLHSPVIWESLHWMTFVSRTLCRTQGANIHACLWYNFLSKAFSNWILATSPGTNAITFASCHRRKWMNPFLEVQFHLASRFRPATQPRPWSELNQLGQRRRSTCAPGHSCPEWQQPWRQQMCRAQVILYPPHARARVCVCVCVDKIQFAVPFGETNFQREIFISK